MEAERQLRLTRIYFNLIFQSFNLILTLFRLFQ